MIKRGQIQVRGRLRWKLRRIRVRMRYGAGVMDSLPVVIGNAIPKCGSTLLFNILRGLTELGPFVDTGLNEIKPYFQGKLTSPRWIYSQLGALQAGDIRFGYLYATEENIKAVNREGWANFLIIRDPRDAIISEIFYALNIHQNHELHKYLSSLDSMETRISTLINGIPSGVYKRVNVRDHFERYLAWIGMTNVHVVRFENLVHDPQKELGNILGFIEAMGFEPNVERSRALEHLHKQMSPDKSNTFRSGKTGQWQNHFSKTTLIFTK